MSRIFISYARKDALDLAKQLIDDLTAAGYGVWQDKRDLDPSRPFDTAIERAIRDAPALIVLITPDVAREDSFVRREIAYALEVGTRIIPLKCPGGVMPVTINLLTFIPFEDYDTGFADLLERLARPETPPTLESRREQERAYLQAICQRFEKWLYLYTDLSGRAQRPRPAVAVKEHVVKYLNTQNAVYRARGFVESGDTDCVETVDELRQVVRQGGIVLIGEPGSGKTTTLERLAYEFATVALEDENAPLPVFVPLGAYTGGGVGAHIASYLGTDTFRLPLAEYLPERMVVLLDGLNEMPRERVSDVDEWLHAHRNVTTVVTCRRLDYAALQALPLRRVDVSPLDVHRIRLFIGNILEDADRDRLFWALAGEQMRDLWALFQRVNLRFEDFWDGDDLKSEHAAYQITSGNQDTIYNQMRAAMRADGDLPGLLGLVTNPFLLNIAVEVFIESGRPPANRAQLFAAFVDLLLERRGRLAVSDEHPWIDAGTQRRALSALAYRMQAENMGTSVPVHWALDALAQDEIVSDAGNLLYLAESATLITVDTVQGELKFFHQLLQEYFAASKLGEMIRYGYPASELWRDGAWWQPTGWEETAVLVAGMQTGVAVWLKDVHPVLACRALTEGLPDPAAVEPVRAALLAAMVGDAPPPARAEVGRVLNRIGDSRHGVTLVDGLDGARLPDLVWCRVEAGPFLYGDKKEERQVDYDYEIAQYPLTHGQFQAFIDAPDGYNKRDWWTDAGWEWKGERTRPDEYGDPLFRLANHPRIFVRWYEAVAFCNWLTAQIAPEVWEPIAENWRTLDLTTIPGLIRLPTEIEWEKAARGTDGRKYPWGDEFDAAKCNMRDTGIEQTSAVGIFPAGKSPCGALDMSGNVWEWCLTQYGSGTNVVESTDSRVLRGGGFGNYCVSLVRAAVRCSSSPEDGLNLFGFRCARLCGP